jgi:hypothetical protein
VDSGWLRSAPATEQSTVATAAPPCDAILIDCDNDAVADGCEVDTDHDGLIDDCDPDDDNDGLPDLGDVARLDPHRCADVDGDGCDDCAIGTDGFGILIDHDPLHDGVDDDTDGLCNMGDPCPADSPNDSDADGVCDSNDVCPGGNDAVDADLDGVADFCDLCPQDNPDDSDGDGVCDAADTCAGHDDTLDADGDGMADDCDGCPFDAANDADGDGRCACQWPWFDPDDPLCDKCLLGDDAQDADGDLIPDACDGCATGDGDYDGVCDPTDVCPGGDDFIDSDADGTPDFCEDCNGNGLADGLELIAGCEPCNNEVNADCDDSGAADTCELEGVVESLYGPPLSIQNTRTAFGDSTLGVVDFANGSELDAAHGMIHGGMLYLVLAGNLESNFNKLDIFIDSVAGQGQNRLRGDNPAVDFDGLNRMGDDGSGNGLTFDAGFAPDYFLSFTGGNNPYQLYGNYAALPTLGNGTGWYLGTTRAAGQTFGLLTDGYNPHAIRATIDNSNTAGVEAGFGPDSGGGVLTGFEIAIPLSAIGSPAGAIRICAFINGSGHGFVSNQVLGPIGGGMNLGEPRNVNFSAISGEQSFIVTPDGDCNENALSDRCELAHGLIADTDGDGALDDCDACPNRRPGDVNGDGVTNPMDVPAFAAVLLNPAAATPDERCAADVNEDMDASGLDIQAFVDLHSP